MFCVYQYNVEDIGSLNQNKTNDMFDRLSKNYIVPEIISLEKFCGIQIFFYEENIILNENSLAVISFVLSETSKFW